jgi:plastin-1
MIRQGFLSADDNSSGKIDNAELHKMFKSFGHSNTEDAISDILKRFDTDNDGQISWLEYIDCYGEL